MRLSVANDDVDLVRLECQYITWLIGHAVRNRDQDTLKRIGDRIQDLIQRTKRILTAKDGNFLSLLNEAIKLRVFIGLPAMDIAQLYDDMLIALEAVHGPEAVRSLMPEYATRLTMAKRDADAEKAIGRFLSEVKQRKLDDRDWVILNQAVNDLATWGVRHPDSYEQLRALRDTGRVFNLSSSPSEQVSSDAELAEDLKAMQGTWHMSSEAIKLELAIHNDQADIAFFDANGKILRRDSARFALSRNGAAKILTRYGLNETQSQGDAMIYFISPDSMVHAGGMLTGMQNQSMPRLRSWTRKP